MVWRQNDDPLNKPPADQSSVVEPENQLDLGATGPGSATRERQQGDQVAPLEEGALKKQLRTQLEEELLEQEGVLIARILKGEAAALEALYERYIDMVYGYIFKRVKNEIEAQSLTSDIFMRAIESLLQGRYILQGKPFGAWLSGIAHHVYSEWKREQYRKSSTIPLEELRGDQHPSSGEDVLEDLIKQEDQSLAWRLVKELPLIELKILVLRHQYHLSYADVAARLHLSEAACKQRYYRAKRILRKKLLQFEAPSEDQVQ